MKKRIIIKNSDGSELLACVPVEWGTRELLEFKRFAEFIDKKYNPDAEPPKGDT